MFANSACHFLILFALAPVVASWRGVGMVHRASSPASRLSTMLRMAINERSRRGRRAKILREFETFDEPRIPEGEAIDDPAASRVLEIVRAADDRKAEDISALRVGHLTSGASFIVNMVGRNVPQINAIVSSIGDDVLERHGVRATPQGKAGGGWVCLDYDDVVVNVFSRESREFYEVDKYWSAAQKLDLSSVVQPEAPNLQNASPILDESDDWVLDDDDWSLDASDFADAVQPEDQILENRELTPDENDDWVLDDDDWSLDAADFGDAVQPEAPSLENRELIPDENDDVFLDDHDWSLSDEGEDLKASEPRFSREGRTGDVDIDEEQRRTHQGGARRIGLSEDRQAGLGAN